MLKVSFGSGALGPASGGDFAWTGTPQTLTWSRDDATMTVSLLVEIREKGLLTAIALDVRDGLLVQTMFCMPTWHQPSLQDALLSPSLPPRLPLPQNQLRT